MKRYEKFGFRLSPREKELLVLVSRREQRTASDVLRRLIREAAERRKLLLSSEDARPEQDTERLEHG